MPFVDDQTTTVEADRRSQTPTGKARRALHRRRPVLVGGAVVLILAIRILLGVTHPSDEPSGRAAGTTGTSPEQTVRALFAAMTARDAIAIHAVTSCHASPLCRPGALASGYLPPTDLQQPVSGPR